MGVGQAGAGRVLVVGPPPLLAVPLGTRADGSGDTVDVDAAGQGAWAARGCLAAGAAVTLVGLAAGRAATMAAAVLHADGVDCRLLPTGGGTGCYVLDRRTSPMSAAAIAWADPPAPDEVSALVDEVARLAGEADVVVVGNAMPERSLPLEVYPRLVATAHDAGAQVVADLSSPRLDAALTAGPDVVKVNDWELAESLTGPVDTPAQRLGAATRLIRLGAGAVVVTRGAGPVLVVRPPDVPSELTPPVLADGDPAGCGDTLTGALAAALAQGRSFDQALVTGVAAGSAHYVRGGEPVAAAQLARLRHHVTVRPAPG